MVGCLTTNLQRKNGGGSILSVFLTGSRPEVQCGLEAEILPSRRRVEGRHASLDSTRYTILLTLWSSGNSLDIN